MREIMSERETQIMTLENMCLLSNVEQQHYIANTLDI